MSELQTLTQMLARLLARAPAPERGAQLDERIGELQPRRGALEDANGFAENLHALRPGLERACEPQPDPDRAGRAGAARELQMLGGEASRLAVVAEARERKRRVGAPARHHRAPCADRLPVTACLLRLGHRVGEPALREPKAPGCLGQQRGPDGYGR